MTMEKKNYIAPVMTVVTVNTQYQMLAGSIEVSSTEYNSETNGAIRSRQGDSFWDDEDE